MSDNTMTYKGYTASIEYSGGDGCLIGDVLGIRAMISMEGQSVAELREDFHRAIDFYLECCTQRGEDPEKPTTLDLRLEIPAEIHSRIAETAEATGHSTNELIVEALRRSYPDMKKAQGRKPRPPAPKTKAPRKDKRRETSGAK